MAERLNKAIIIKDDKTFNKLLKKLTDTLVNTFEAQQKKALNEVIDYLIDIGEVDFKQSHADEINSIIQNRLGKNLSDLVEDSFLKLHNKIYKFGVDEVASSVKMKLSFGVVDKDAAELLGKQNLFFVGDYYNETLAKDFDEVLSGYFDGEKTIQQIADDFELRFEDKIGKGRSYYEGLAEHSTSRVRELGKITGMEKAAVEYYEHLFILDDHTSDICQELAKICEGKKFLVSKAVEFRDKILSMEDPREIRDIAPWRTAAEIKGLTAEELPEGLTIAPFHFRCRAQTIVSFA